ncbi:SdrD B-like domain-containing protein [Enterococcus sp. LJL51]|uniref:SdrD B-like domain-containing protein n=1 Tax=Enterococcus sp. LJL51 TaxID=3416656 RepID=UPI003CEC1237
MKKYVYLLLFLSATLFSFLAGQPAPAKAAWSPSIYTITGNKFIDVKRDGIFTLSEGDLPVKNQRIELYKTALDAQNQTNLFKAATTSAVGTYSFSGLQKGTYYIRYDENNGYAPLIQSQTYYDALGKPFSGILEIKVNSLLVSANLAVTKSANLNFHVFSDLNSNGMMDSTEKRENNKTMVIVNLTKTSEALNNGGLGDINQAELIGQAMKGSITIGDGAIQLLTTKNNQPIQLPDSESGIYVAFRSPFNLKLSELIVNLPKINALLDIILSSNDFAQLIDNPDLISTGDITTTPDYDYLKDLSDFFSTALHEVDQLNLDQYLGSDISTLIAKGQNISKLIRNFPAMRFISVDVWGNSYDLTNFQVQKTADFFYGIRPYVTIKGTVFDDLNGDGVRNGLTEPLHAIPVTAYDKNGRKLSTVISPERLGTYTLKELPYDQDIYLVAETDIPTTTIQTNIPAALSGKQIIAVYHLSSLEAESTISQNIALRPN